MTVSFIAAASENNVIGNKNGLPWHLPNDLKYFKNTTWGMPVIMGRKTFESFGKALSGRTNIIITTQAGWKADAAVAVGDMEKALTAARDTDAKECFIIGGGEIFKQFIPEAAKLYITRVHAVVEGDVFFPVFNQQEWKQVSNLDFAEDEKHAHAYTFQVWERMQ